ncbi:MAG: hypothetical protein JWQ23_438, partial [Herminiimonas sp.]|nr:hypothetical protein [Herminiimonas sp.]
MEPGEVPGYSVCARAPRARRAYSLTRRNALNEITKTQYSPRTKIQSPRLDTSREIASSTERLPQPGSRLPISNEPAVSSRTPTVTSPKTSLTARIDGLIQDINFLIRALKRREKGKAFAPAAKAAQRANEVLHAASDLIVERIRPHAKLLQREAKPLGEERWEVDATVVNAGKDSLEIYKAHITDALKHMATVITLLKKVPPAPEGQPTVIDLAKEIRHGISALDRSRAASG